MKPSCVLSCTALGLALLLRTSTGAQAPPDKTKGPKTLAAHKGTVWSVAFSPDGKTLASVGEDRAIRLWEVLTGKNIVSLEGHTKTVLCVAFSPDGKILASGSVNGELILWDVATRRSTALLKRTRGNSIDTLAFSPDGAVLAAGGQDQKVDLWDVATRKKRTDFGVGFPQYPNSVAYTAAGKPLAVSEKAHTFTIWDLAGGKKTIIDTDITTTSLCRAFTRDGKTVAAGFGDGKALIWEVASGKLVASIKSHHQINCLAFSPAGKTLAVGAHEYDTKSGGTIRLWDIARGRQLVLFKGHKGGLFCVAFSPDGKTLASAGADGTIKLWYVSGLPKPAK
jgi:WD40 repeat protein